MPVKGNLLVGQSGGPTAVINASLAGVIEEAKKHPEIGEIYGAVNGVEGILAEELVDLRAEDDQMISLLPDTPSAEFERISSTPLRSLSASSMGLVTRFSISLGEAPGYNVTTMATGADISGSPSLGSA